MWMGSLSLKISYCTVLTFWLKESTLWFSLAYRNCQHHYSRALGPLFSKIRVTWIEELQYHYTGANNWNSYYVTDGQVVYAVWTQWTKMVTHLLHRTGWNFITLLRMVCFKFYELFNFGIFNVIFLDLCMTRCNWHQGEWDCKLEEEYVFFKRNKHCLPRYLVWIPWVCCCGLDCGP